MILPSTLLLLLSLIVGAQAETPEDVSLKELLDSLREIGDKRYTLMYAFAKQKEAPEAVLPLLQLQKDEAPKLDNDICLAVLAILEKHPDATCPLDPVLDVIRRRVWTSQQKGCLLLREALRNETAWKGREDELNAALIPLLTSQRSRVYGSALSCLKKINGRVAGPDADAWKKFYGSQYPGKTLDLEKAVYEALAVIRPSVDEPYTFEVNGEKVSNARELIGKLSELERAAKERGFDLSIVIQAQDEIRDERGKYPPNVEKAIQAVTNYFIETNSTRFSYTVSPGSDLFRAPYAPKAAFRRDWEF